MEKPEGVMAASSPPAGQESDAGLFRELDEVIAVARVPVPPNFDSVRHLQRLHDVVQRGPVPPPGTERHKAAVAATDQIYHHAITALSPKQQEVPYEKVQQLDDWRAATILKLTPV